MKRRPPPSFTTVVKPSKRSAVPPAAAPPRRPAQPAGKIKTWHADDPPKPAPSGSKLAYLQDQVTAWVNRIRLANNPEVLRRAAEKLAQRDEAEKASASIMPLPHHQLGGGYLIVAKEGSFHTLGQALKMLLSGVTFVKPDRSVERSPSSLRPFIKSMRKGEG